VTKVILEHEYGDDLGDIDTKILIKPIVPSLQHSIIPWPRPGFDMALVIILMSRQGGPVVSGAN